MRQLAAILFTDMTGYTALMQENEQLARSKRLRLKEVLESTVNSFNGRVLQYYGDGSLSIFRSTIDKVGTGIIQALLNCHHQSFRQRSIKQQNVQAYCF